MSLITTLLKRNAADDHGSGDDRNFMKKCFNDRVQAAVALASSLEGPERKRALEEILDECLRRADSRRAKGKEEGRYIEDALRIAEMLGWFVPCEDGAMLPARKLGSPSDN